MNKQDIENEVRQVVVDQIGAMPTAIRRETTFEQLGIDALDRVEIAMEVEERYNITLPDDLPMEVTTFGEFVDGVEKTYMEARGATGDAVAPRE